MTENFLLTHEGVELISRADVATLATKDDPVVVATGPGPDDRHYWHSGEAGPGLGWDINDAGVLTIGMHEGGDVLRVYSPNGYLWVEGPKRKRRPGRVFSA